MDTGGGVVRDLVNSETSSQAQDQQRQELERTLAAKRGGPVVISDRNSSDEIQRAKSANLAGNSSRASRLRHVEGLRRASKETPRGTQRHDKALATKVKWCREGDLNPHNPFGSADFKSAASASFAIPAREGNQRTHVRRRRGGRETPCTRGFATERRASFPVSHSRGATANKS